MAAELVRAGADGLVLFNRFYAPDIDLLTLRVTRSLPLSTAAELPLSLVWIALLSRRVACSLAASRGVESEVEVVKYLLAGADAVMTASALLRHGPQHVETMRDGLERWLFANGFDSVDANSRPQGRHPCRGCRCVDPRAGRRRAHRLPARQARVGFWATPCQNRLHDAQPLLYSSWRRHQTPVSLRPLGARSSHWYMPQRPSSPRA